MRLVRVAAPLLLAALVAACSGASATSAPATAPASATSAPTTAPASATSAPTTAPASAAASAAASASSTTASGGGYGGGGYGSGASAGGSSPAAAGGLALAKTSLGTILVGPTGMTLYALMSDTATTSTCTGNCAGAWPPLTGDLPSLGAGLDATKFSNLTRADGTKQITFNGHPLYSFGGDKAAGDTNGQGVGGKWYVLGSDGNPIK